MDELNKYFSKEERQIAEKLFLEVLTPLASGEMKTTTLRFHLSPVRMAAVKETNNNKGWGGCEGRGTVVHCW